MMEIIVVIICWTFILAGFLSWQARLHATSKMAHKERMGVLSRERDEMNHRHWKEAHELTSIPTQEQLKHEELQVLYAGYQLDSIREEKRRR
jgi:hypothetical protein